MHQIGKQPELESGQLDGRAIECDARRARIEPQEPAFELRLGHARAAAQESPDPGDDLLHLERLGDIIVGPGIDARHLLAPAVARGQDQHRRLYVGPAPAFEDGQAVDLGQPQIEDDRVVGLGLAEIAPSSPSNAASAAYPASVSAATS